MLEACLELFLMLASSCRTEPVRPSRRSTRVASSSWLRRTRKWGVRGRKNRATNCRIARPGQFRSYCKLYRSGRQNSIFCRIYFNEHVYKKLDNSTRKWGVRGRKRTSKFDILQNIKWISTSKFKINWSI